MRRDHQSRHYAPEAQMDERLVEAQEEICSIQTRGTVERMVLYWDV